MDYVHQHFEKISEETGGSEKSRTLARSAFGVTGRKDWWGRSKIWDKIFDTYLPKRRKDTTTAESLPRCPPRFDETVSVVNSWYHATGFGVLQRMLCIILKELSHQQLQAFYLLLDSFDKNRVYKDTVAKTNSRNFILHKSSTTFNRRISRMIDSYSNMFVACECLEIVMGYDCTEVVLFRNLHSCCVSYLFDFGEGSDFESKSKWESKMVDILEEGLNCALRITLTNTVCVSGHS